MSDPDADEEGFDEKLRAFAREFTESVERAAERLDLNSLAEQIQAGGEQLRQLAEFAGQWMSETFEPGGGGASRGDAGADRRRRVAGPHPLDLPTEEQALALSALASGRWRVKPGTNGVVTEDDEPAPGVSLGVAGELRARDWIKSDGEVTDLGHAALRRWSEGAEPATTE